MLLQGDKVRLRTITDEDLKALFRMYNDPTSWGEYEEFRPVDWFAFEKAQKEPPSTPTRPTLFIIEKLDSKAIIGIIFHRISHPVTRNIEIGYAILASGERGKGCASEAAKLMVDYLFLNQNIERIEAYTDTRNIPSQHVLEKCGFKKEGTLRKARYVAAAYRDYYVYGLLREEWSPPKS